MRLFWYTGPYWLHFVLSARWIVEPTNGINRVVSSTGSCSSGENAAAVPYLFLLGVINLSVVVFANVQAYRARTIHTEYSESRYIGLIMLCLLQSWLTGLPVLGLVYETPRANYVVITFIMFPTTTTVLLLMFVSKVRNANSLLEHRKTAQLIPTTIQSGTGGAKRGRLWPQGF
jgi:hypothetical protein